MMRAEYGQALSSWGAPTRLRVFSYATHNSGTHFLTCVTDKGVYTRYDAFAEPGVLGILNLYCLVAGSTMLDAVADAVRYEKSQEMYLDNLELLPDGTVRRIGFTTEEQAAIIADFLGAGMNPIFVEAE
jgi:hypothetical protein